MRVKNEKWIVMTFDDSRAPIRARQIGKGRWTTAYLDDDRHVYLFVAVRPDGGTDYAKEAIANFIDDGNLHVPRIERFDEIDGIAGEGFNVYRSDFYYPLTAKSAKAWKQFKRLAIIADEEHRKIVNSRAWNDHSSIAHLGHGFMNAVIERARADAENFTPELVEALELLRDATENYGQTWWFEFAKRNCAVDARGNLILLDCIFDREQVEREHKSMRRSA